MNEQEGVSIRLPLIPRSDSKVVGEKRRSDELEERPEFSKISTHDRKTILDKGSSAQLKLKAEEMSQVTEVSRKLDVEGSEARNKNKQPDLEVRPTLRQLDLNTDTCIANDSASGCGKRKPPVEKHSGEKDSNLACKGVGLDLNADAVSSSVNDGSLFCSSKNNLKMRDAFSECGSSTAPLEEKDPMKVWKEMKQNGFLSCPHGAISASSCFVSSSHGGIPAPRKRGRKTKNDGMKKKMEIARREEVDRFAKIAAPSGLLNHLNPGIINHVRNKKQVLSIIKNIVRSKKDSGSNLRTQMKSGNDVSGTRKNQEDVQNTSIFHRDEPVSGCNQAFTHMDKSCTKNSEDKKCGGGDLSMVDAISEEADALMLKHPSATNASENVGSLSNEELANFGGASVLTVKAATVASQWLELLHQDIKGRLSALRRSKKRVRAVITTELPFLILKEFSSNQENNIADMHRSRWTMLFNQMDQTLSEEERQLETWLNEVKELQLHCDQGLHHLSWNSGLQLGLPEADSIAREAASSQMGLAVYAAAASVYSTCNFLTSKENISCS